MKYHFFLLLLFVSVLGFGQKLKPDFKSIEKNLTNKQSPYNYDKLIFKYKAYPKSLDSLEAQYLYYGRNFQENKVSTMDDDFKKLAEFFKERNADECVKLGTALYQKDPTNLDVLLILLRAYDSKQDASNFSHHVSQFRLLTDAIKKSGDGKTEKTAYLVNSVGDEYILLNILQIGEDFTRGSKPLKDGMLDIWEKDNSKVYIKVLYLDY
ncbi:MULTISPECIES: DUF4919 domain-containing protein [Chryseobacterium]|uniref:DUF4919 domain-containing protein n=1 Tax=Chryseobacterium geocarposphaerae TaxID=1416776 RepID=A0ABU1LDV2_9FLAO|nr:MULTISPECIES: DUF4919 domain-containing protein [Chryseobacterium]ALR32009.1 hypothetical protein ATE47_16440 [Chryseobacterium sp. IHB B 17019]MDR6404905.1 hypothetical protein [Chryseobacterium geocarposphaerae]MDR6697688.1 hypothetical protein [Chryseobacterium ginsenosidimutans]